MLGAFVSAFKTPDLRRKLLFTLGIVALYRLGSTTPTPGVSYKNIQACVQSIGDNSIYGLINLFSGGALLQLTVFALGVLPYITASIIFQLLTVVIPRLETLQKEGPSGQAKITQYTRYLTLALAILQSTALLAIAREPGRFIQGCDKDIIPNQSLFVIITMVMVMTAGTALVMWFAELITDRGVGNGMSLLIFTSIIAGLPGQVWSIYRTKSLFVTLFVVIIGIAIITGIVFVEQAQRRIPVQYAKRMVGRKQYGGTSTYLPLKLNMAGVIPVIFASSLLYLPVLLTQLVSPSGSTDLPPGWVSWINNNFTRGDHPIYVLAYAALIIFFTYFYIAITFNPVDVSDDMKKFGGFIPGIRAGRPTAEYLDYVISRITFPGSIYLAAIAVVPLVAFQFLGVGQNFIFGGTSILIIVGVGLDTVKQIQSQLQQRNYEGFLR